MIIAIDGPAASGKGTIARAVAAHYGLPHLDTGALYRAVGHTVLAAGGDPSDAETARKAAETLDLSGIDAELLRSDRVGNAASKVAAVPAVRAALLAFQQRFAAQAGGAVLDGRDIGTVVCPDADVKLFVTASPEVRAERRYKELAGRGEAVRYDDVLADIEARDARDAGRSAAPMARAEDAHLLDTSNLSIEAAVAKAIEIIDGR